MAEAAPLAKAQTHCALPSVHGAHEQRPRPVMPALPPFTPQEECSSLSGQLSMLLLLSGV